MKYPICAYRMAKAEWNRWRVLRAWRRSGDDFLMAMADTTPPWPPFSEMWRQWLEAYDTAAERD